IVTSGLPVNKEPIAAAYVEGAVRTAPDATANDDVPTSASASAPPTTPRRFVLIPNNFLGRFMSISVQMTRSAVRYLHIPLWITLVHYAKWMYGHSYADIPTF